MYQYSGSGSVGYPYVLALPDPLVRVRIRGSGFYPDPYQNVTDPQQCLLGKSIKAVIAYEPSTGNTQRELAPFSHIQKLCTRAPYKIINK
jgi:hypothetical protein